MNEFDTGTEPKTTRTFAAIDRLFEMLAGDGRFFADSCKPNASVDSDDSSPNDPPWVLCIDDDADFSKALQLRLGAFGVVVVRAFDGSDGYRCAFEYPASAILLDYNMPNGQGDYVLGRLKDNPVTRDIPVIVITGLRNKALERKMLSMGAASYMTKPVDFDQLREELSKHLDILHTPAIPQSSSATF